MIIGNKKIFQMNYIVLIYLLKSSVRCVLHKWSVIHSFETPLAVQFSPPLTMGLSLNVKLVRQDGVQTVLSFGAGSRTLNLAHLDSFQSESPDKAEQCQRDISWSLSFALIKGQVRSLSQVDFSCLFFSSDLWTWM